MVWVPQDPCEASSEGSQQTIRLELKAVNFISLSTTLERGTRTLITIIPRDTVEFRGNRGVWSKFTAFCC